MILLPISSKACVLLSSILFIIILYEELLSNTLHRLDPRSLRMSSPPISVDIESFDKFKINTSTTSENKLTRRQYLLKSGVNRSLWPDDPDCSRFTVGFSSGLPLVWLASYPRSGNSWTRYLIESATGIYTNSIYADPTMVGLGFDGEAEKIDSGRCIVTKIHRQWKSLVNYQEVPTILLIRNPARSLVSNWNLHLSPVKDNSSLYFYSKDEESYASQDFRNWWQYNIDYWRYVSENCLLWSKKLLVVFYEDLCENPMKQLHRILDFLKVEPDSARMVCISKYIEGYAKGAQRKIDPYTLEENMDLKNAIKAVEKAANHQNITLPDYVKQIYTGYV